MPYAGHDGPLITVDRLARRMADAPGKVTLLDIRWSLTGPPGIEEYRAGHLPGARFVDLDTQLAAPAGRGGRHPLPDTAAFQGVARAAGVRAETQVVVYDAADSTAAARAWWLLRYFGHRDTRVLDGGYAAWVRAGQAVVTGDDNGRSDAPGCFTALPGSMPLLDADGAAKRAVLGVLLDARAAARFRGEIETVDPVAGHIPGAVSAPTSDNLEPDGHFLPAKMLRARFGELGAGRHTGREVGTYCGSGVTAAHEVLALEIAGISAALYVGSWSDWITDPARPVATGP
jgi:thiosulfate/3-mercaptopyruvate sulfurtransferase